MKNVLYFLAGAAVGSIVTYKVVMSRFEIIGDEEEINEESTDKPQEEKKESKDSSEDLKRCAEIIKEQGYKTYSNPNVPPEEDDCNEGEIDMENGDIRILTPDEFAEDMAYDTETWFLYTDGVVTDAYHHVIEDPKAYIGDAIDHFGEYEEDSVFIRNSETMVDYELLRDSQSWEEAKKYFPENDGPCYHGHGFGQD